MTSAWPCKAVYWFSTSIITVLYLPMIPGQLNFQKGLRSNTDLLFPQKQKKKV